MADRKAAPGSADVPPLHLALVPWLLVSPLLLYLAFGQDHPVALERFALDTVACLFFGGALWMLRSFPPLRQPHWVAVVVVGSGGVTFFPGGAVGALYLIGLLAVCIVPGWWIGRRFRVRWWAAALAVPPAVLVLHTLHCYGAEDMGAAKLAERLVDDVTRPLRSERLPPPADVGPPIIVISVDTLRADSAASMRTVARLKERGAWWPSAMSTSSWTMPALASLQTGTMPVDHGAGCLLDGACQGMRDDAVTLASRLSDAGYATGAVSVNPWAGRGNGFARGFDIFRDLGNVPPRRFLFARHAFAGEHPQDGGVAVDIALDVLDRLDAGGSFYLWVHTIDPHLPYTHSDDPRMANLEVGNLRSASTMSDAFRDAVRAAYAHEVEVIDGHLMRLLDDLEARGLLDRALVVFTSDHGEEFWENGTVEHGHNHLREVIEVPLVVSGPGVVPGERHGTASLLDVPHTALRAAGLETDGVDLRQPIPPGRIATAEGNLHFWAACSARNTMRKAVIDGCMSERDRWSYGFDLEADPDENHRIQLPPYHAVQQAVEAIEHPVRHGETDQSTEALRALGYVD